MNSRLFAPTLLALTFVASTALASSPAPSLEAVQTADEEDASGHQWSPTLGVRLGGYGFRQLNADNTKDWENCKMEGGGVFGTLRLTDNLYAEMSTDLYFATDQTLKSGIDRISLHTVAALGARFAPDFIISPLIQIGGGAEYTWVQLFGERSQALLPVGFIGAGGELNLGDVHLGVTARFNAMQLPSYVSAPGNDDFLEYNTQVSGQMLFSFRYTL